MPTNIEIWQYSLNNKEFFWLISKIGINNFSVCELCLKKIQLPVLY